MTIIDTHMHLFEKPYGDLYDNSHVREGAKGELHLYEEYRRSCAVEAAFVICYQGGHCPRNNSFVEKIRDSRPWIYSFGHLQPDSRSLLSQAMELDRDGHFGLSCYLDADDSGDWLSSERLQPFWEYISAERMPLSLNIRAAQCRPLAGILERYPGLIILISHMARPRLRSGKLDEEDYAPLLSLAGYPGVYVKLSGFYAFTEDGWRYPQRPLFQAVDLLRAAFGSQRLLFATDFPPVLEYNTFRQAIELLQAEYKGFTPQELQAVYRDNAHGIIERRR
ncbi:MAG: amidohydrolase family protein [bacterium]|nr:amidohydrolase family protein [bacterium]